MPMEIFGENYKYSFKKLLKIIYFWIYTKKKTKLILSKTAGLPRLKYSGFEKCYTFFFKHLS